MMTPDHQQQRPSSRRLYMGGPIQTRDRRPIRNRDYKAQMQRELFEYMSTNKFDIQMKQQLTARSLRSPTQKEFVLMFQFLYKKIDPGFKFVRTIEQDVYAILKFLEYPYLDNINKSQLSAVGGTKWTVFLAMLYWLLHLVQQVDKFDEEDIDNLQMASTVTSRSDDGNDDSVVFSRKVNVEDEVILGENSLLDRLFTRFVLNSYRQFLMTGTDDYSTYFNEMKRKYLDCTRSIVRKAQKLIDENVQLTSELKAKLTEQGELHTKVERFKALQIDVDKFQKYMDSQIKRSKRWPVVLNKANEDIADIKKNIANAEEEKQKIVAALKEKGFSLEEIQQMHQERSQLSSDFDSFVERQSQVTKEIEEKVTELKSHYDTLEGLIEEYNSILRDVGGETVTLSSKSLEEYGLKPSEIVPVDDEQLGKMKSQIHKSWMDKHEKCLQAEEQLEDSKLKSVSLGDQLQETSESLERSKAEYTELSETKSSEVKNLQVEIGKVDEDIHGTSTELQQAKQKAQKEYDTVKSQLKSLTMHLAEQRNALLIQIAGCIDHVISFKTGIMGDLESCNRELAEN